MGLPMDAWTMLGEVVGVTVLHATVEAVVVMLSKRPQPLGQGIVHLVVG